MVFAGNNLKNKQEPEARIADAEVSGHHVSC